MDTAVILLMLLMLLPSAMPIQLSPGLVVHSNIMDTTTTLLSVLTLLTLLPSAISVPTQAATPAPEPNQLSQGCKVHSHLKNFFAGPLFNINVWNSKEKLEILGFAIPYKETGYIGLFIDQDNIKFDVVNEDKSENFYNEPIDPPFDVGWMDIQVEFGKQLKVIMPGRPIMEVDVSADVDELMLDGIDITGSNVTVNCLENIRHWRVSGGAAQVLPLAGAGTHQVTVYTMTSSLPHVSVEDVGHLIHGTPNTKPRHKRSLPLLPPLTIQKMTVTCKDGFTDHLTCSMEVVGSSGTHELKCPREGCYFTVFGRHQDTFLVYLKSPTSALNDDSHIQGFITGIVFMSIIGIAIGAALRVCTNKKKRTSNSNNNMLVSTDNNIGVDEE